MITKIATFLALPGAAWGFSLFILGVFVGVLAWFEISLMRLRSDVLKGLDVIRGSRDPANFRATFQSVSAQLEAIPSLRRGWRDYTSHLVIPPPGAPGGVTTTELPSDHFTIDSLSVGRVPLRFFSSFPNILVGFGIFGTFLGLAAGIHLVAPNLQGSANDMKVALGGLLGGAFLSFLKSAVAILCSIAFTLFERHGIAKVESAVDDFSKALDRVLSLETPERIAHDQLGQLRRHTEQLDALKSEVTTRILPALEQLQQGLVELKVERATSNEQFLTSSLDEFRKTLQGAAGTELQTLAATLATVRETVERSAHTLATGNEQFENANLRVSRAIEETLESATTGLQQHFAIMGEGVKASLAESTRTMAEQLQAGGRALTDQVALQSQHLTEGADAIQSTLATFKELLASTNAATDKMSNVAESFATVHNQFGASMDALETIESSIRAASEKLQSSAESQNHYTQVLSDSARTVTIAVERTTTSWTEYQKRFEGLDQSLGKVFQELDAGLARYSEKIREYVLDVEREMAKATENLAGAVGQLSDDLSELPGEVKDLGEHIRAMRTPAQAET